MKIIYNIIKKEILQFSRDPKMISIVIFAPIIQLILFGYATNFDVNVIRTTIYDMDKSVESRELLNQLEASGYYDLNYYVNSYDEVQENLEKEKSILAIVIPHNFGKNIKKNIPAKLQAIFDASNGNTASVADGYTNAIIFNYAKKINLDLQELKGKKITKASIVEPEIRVWYNPELKTRNFIIPGIVALLMMIITLILTSLAIVKEKEIGTLEQLIVTPIKSHQLILGKLVPAGALGFVSVIVVIIAMRLVFGISVRGSYTFLLFTSSLYLLSMLGFGLLISTISKTQQQSMMFSIFAVMMPMIYLSGFVFPIENMPKTIQLITYLIPLRYFITIIRGIVLKGNGIVELWQQTVILFAMGILILIISSLRFRKRLE